MTTTAKIFTILVCLFAFIFTPMAIQFAARVDNWRQLAQGYQDQAETDAAYARSVQAIAASQFVDAKARHDQDQQQIAEARRQIDLLNQQIAALTAERNQLVLANEKLKTTNELQTGALAVVTRHHDEMAKTNKGLRDRELDLQTRNAQLLDRNKELTADTVVLKQQLNQRIQEVAVAREENETLRKQQGLGRAGEFTTGGAVASTAQPAAVGPRAPVRGQVKAVQGNLATVDVGSSSGVKPGMTMVVTRSAGTSSVYVCDLVITSEVSPTEAVGEIKREQDRRIRPGDVVVDDVSFEEMARS